ncbi:DNA repair metallo-beta-lactamase-domain-containing protein [Fomitopsis serialis]|uniref:DNA repair metallo-beta-lactamase-domain-containing protein n=1 Tax=Fomitopsis serialis TaxID=139415 RepID=UPI002007FF7B|nr:DNA repair metallo-beta-lactamase-domain-containing protein [Neoantrodia serialis]KAH9930298.1 DNA repair metallo-beta-lactamase-domain-containing protein [Neoantrodia serialis]
MGDDEVELEEMASADAQEEDAVDIDLTLEEDTVEIDLTLDEGEPLPLDQGVETCPLCAKKLGGLNSFVHSKAGVFSVLMTSHKENEAWKEASVAEDRNFRPTKGNGGRRKAPFYKVMQGMPIAVDAFRYGAIPGVTAYFLTHAHSDHYTNLSAKWAAGLSTVTCIEANHYSQRGRQRVQVATSGSPKIFRYLHCGDFRASPAHVLHPAIKGKRIDHYCFPPQPQVIPACAELARRIVAGIPLHEDAAKAKQNRTMDGWVTTSSVKTEQKEQVPGRTLVVVGTYSIGKERIVKAIARALQTKVFCDSRKAAILRCQADPELHELLTKDPLEGGVHLVPLGVIASDRLKEYVERFKGHYSRAVGFRPTGWTFTAPTGSDMLPSVQTIISRSQSRTFTYAQMNPMKNSTPALQVYGVPYSEHSSFFELTCFALSLDWGKMIATVNVGSENSRKKMSKWFERWEAERKKMGKDEVVGHRAGDYW